MRRLVPAAALVAVAALVVGFVALRSADSGPATKRLVPVSVAYVLRDGHDDRVIHALVDVVGGRRDCGAGPAPEVVAQSAGSVTLGAYSTAPAPSHSDSGRYELTFCGTVKYSEGVTLRLSQPLGHRAVVVGPGRWPVHVVAADDVPIPAYLPPGFTGSGELRVMPLELSIGAPAPWAYREYTNGRARLRVSAFSMPTHLSTRDEGDSCVRARQTAAQRIDVCLDHAGSADPDDLLDRVVAGLRY